MIKLIEIRGDRGAVLLVVLTVILILLLIFFAFFSLTLSTLARLRNQANQTRAAYLAEAGINRFLYVLGDSTSWQDAQNIRLDEKISETESFSVTAGIAGGYISVKSSGQYRAAIASRTALIGRRAGRKFNCAIINGASEYPLTVAGRTTIIGDIRVGPAAVATGEIEGEYYDGDKFNEGEIYTDSHSPLNGLDTSFIRTYLTLLEKEAAATVDVHHGSLVMSGDRGVRPGTGRVFLIDGDLEIVDLTMKSGTENVPVFCTGRVVIRGRNNIEGVWEIYTEEYAHFKEGSIIRNIAVTAGDSIVFERGALFSGQAICAGVIEIKDGAVIDYPSLLYVHGSASGRKIHLKGGSLARTIAVLEGGGPFKGDRGLISVDKGADISGILYSGDFIELRDRLKGIAACDYFSYQAGQALYINWLKDAYIDRNRLDFSPVLPVSVSEGNNYAVFQICE